MQSLTLDRDTEFTPYDNQINAHFIKTNIQFFNGRTTWNTEFTPSLIVYVWLFTAFDGIVAEEVVVESSLNVRNSARPVNNRQVRSVIYYLMPDTSSASLKRYTWRSIFNIIFFSYWNLLQTLNERCRWIWCTIFQSKAPISILWFSKCLW